MGEKVLNILVLCTGNSARSLIGEALLNHLGGGRIKAHSAGSHPAGAPHPDALAVLKAHGVPAEALRSKHWEEFSVPGAPEMDVVLTVCDRAASEVCPVWPGAPVACHWGLPDPAATAGGRAARRAAFEETFRAFERRVRRLVGPGFDGLSAAGLAARLTAADDRP